MARYIRGSKAPKAEFYSDDCNRPDTVYVCEHQDVDTGLVFEDGTPIMRAPNPIGFGRDDEW